MCCNLPVPALMDAAFRLGGFFSFFGRMVSLLGFRRMPPSARPEAERSWFTIDACATEGTVSVSTVMLRSGGSRARVDMEDSDGFAETECWGRWAKVERCSCILPFLALLDALSLPLSVCLEWSCLKESCFELRSSVTLDELTSFRSVSDLWATSEETKLECVNKVCGW